MNQASFTNKEISASFSAGIWVTLRVSHSGTRLLHPGRENTIIRPVKETIWLLEQSKFIIANDQNK